MGKSVKYIFMVGGVMSGVGKGITSSSIGRLLKSRGFSVSSIKIDPYVNVDAGTMNPTEHGEVFVLDDGTECDMDMGNYERFLDRDFDGGNYMTTGSVYQSVIRKERNLEYGGRCVHVVPDIPLEVLDKIKEAGKKDKADFVMTEIGGTLGEYQNMLFLEAIRMLQLEKPGDVIIILVSFLPFQGKGGNELKTKPTQHAVRDMNYVGLQPDIVIARARADIDDKRKEKISFHCSVRKKDVISAPDVESIYDVPLNFEKDGLTGIILEKFGLRSKKVDLKDWKDFVKKSHKVKKEVKIGIIGKYFETGKFVLSDSYASVIEAIKHASYKEGRKPVIEWINSEDFEGNIRAKELNKKLKVLSSYDGVIIPGGFGSRGVEGKIKAIEYVRKNKIPFLGLCYGMQLMLVEFARNICGLKGANTTEINPNTKYPVVGLMPEQEKVMSEGKYGATMRLGAYPAILKPGTLAFRSYKREGWMINNKKKIKEYGIKETEGLISERHRHRYEVNPEYIDTFKKHGLIFSGVSPSRNLMEVSELPRKEHPFFVGVQFHPEFKSHPLKPHPLFVDFIKASVKKY